MAVPPDRFETARLVLRPIELADSGAIFAAYAQDAEVARYLSWRPYRDREALDRFVAGRVAIPPSESRAYVMISRADGTLLGSLELRCPAAHRFDFGYVLARRWWGQGLMTEALTEVVSWSLRQDGVFRVGALCDAENVASARVMERAGLVREGLLRRWLIHPNISDEPRDCFSYAKVR
jgi:RimJ/RimL family protein N-acetyltransferase